MDDPYEVLGVTPGTPQDKVRAAYRELVRLNHPDRHPDDNAEEREAQHARMASINAAYRMLSDPRELERFRRLQRRRERGRASAEPGRDGVRFTAANPSSGGDVDRSPGDPDFDYRRRAWREFTVDDGTVGPVKKPWSGRGRRSRRRRR